MVPTYNEKENVRPLLEGIDKTLSDENIEYEVIIVDDDSPDGTWKVARELSSRFPVRVVRRVEQSGLATSVIRGFEKATSDQILVMDADLQHPPERIPEFVSALDGGVDIVVGSRFVDGGSPGDFGLLRLTMSRLADIIARSLFRELRRVSDIQSGFFALDRSVIADAQLRPRGYKILIETLVMGHYTEVEEVGYEFGSRRAGESKLGTRTVFDYLLHLLALRRRRRVGKNERINPVHD